MSEHEKFKKECIDEIRRQCADSDLRGLTNAWIDAAGRYKYSYHFEWLGRPIIQHPQDMVGMQQLMWKVRPDLVIETGIARGGSLIFYASILELIALCGGHSDSKVLGIDIDIRERNRQEILKHPMAKRIKMIEGSSISNETVSSVYRISRDYKNILVCLDSNHTLDHVFEELKIYAPLVSKGSYCVVFDTIIEDMPDEFSAERPWGRGDNPKIAVRKFLNFLQQQRNCDNEKEGLKFEIDKDIEAQLLITVAPDGFLRRV